MKIIAIEGLDKAGKYSQSILLTKYLESKGNRVVQSEFHRYDTPTGELIQKWLRNEWDVSQLTIELIMSADKQAQQDWFTQLAKDGVDYLILDRYTTSQRVYAASSGVNPGWTEELQSYMRIPDIEILIDIPAEVSMRRKGKHGDNDRYESSKTLLNHVREQYLIHFDPTNKSIFNPTYKFSIDGLCTVEEIHRDIISQLDRILSK